MKSIAKSLISTIVSLSMAGCGSGVQTGKTTNVSVNPTSLKIKKTSASVPVTDLYKLNYGPISALSECSQGNQVCITINAIPQPEFQGGLNGNSQWIIQNYPTSLTINFMQNIDKDFHVSDIYNKLSNHDLPSGHISQINTSDCDTLVQQGSLAGKSCNIKLVYTGDNFTNTTNDVHLNFKWGNSQNNFDFNFNTTNLGLSGDSLPILNLQDVATDVVKGAYGNLVINILPIEINQGTYIDYDLQVSNKVHLVNNGLAPITTNQAQPIATIGMGLAADIIGGDNLIMYFANLTCLIEGGCEDLVSGAADDFQFNYFLPAGPVLSKTNNFVFEYNNGTQTVNYVKPFILSLGNVKYQDYIIGSAGGVILVEKPNLGTSYLSYSAPLKNFTITANYNPEFNLASAVTVGADNQPDKLAYSYGDAGNATNIADLVNQVKFDFDPNCFTSGYDPQYDGSSSVPTSRVCGIQITAPNAIINSINKPLQFLLYATYDSPTENRHVEQIIGTVTILAARSLPLGNPVDDYQARCQNFNFDGTTLNASCPNNSLQYVPTSLDYSTCAPGSTVNEIDGSLGCDNMIQSLPPGNSKGYDYQTRCKALTFNHNILSGICLNDNLNYVGSNLDYSSCTGSTVSDLHGVLTCDQPKTSCNLVYHQTGGNDFSIIGDTTFQRGDCIQVDGNDGIHKYELDMEQNGNFAWYKCAISDIDCISDPNRQAIVSSATDGVHSHSQGMYTKMQHDGNLVVYDNNNQPISWTATNGNPQATLRLQADGNLVIYTSGHDGEAGYQKWQAADGFKS